MRRLNCSLIVAAFVSFFLASWAYFGEAEAARITCGGSNPPCNINGVNPSRYFAYQTALSYTKGVRGFISAQDVAIHDYSCENASPNPGCDFIANGLQFYLDDGGGLQLGFIEGAVPWIPGAPFRSSLPKVFMEWDTVCDGQNLIELGTPAASPRYNEFFEIRWTGLTETCGARARCLWVMGRGVMFAPIATFRGSWAGYREGNASVGTEHFNNKYMEPNGVQCFGGGFSGTPCTSIPMYGYDLSLYLPPYFYLWTHPPFSGPVITERACPPPSSNYGYLHHINQAWQSFRTEGCWQ